MLPIESLSVTLSTFTLIALAEIGDKSQIVCMALAARHRHWPVILGAASAFVALNALAVLFGAGIALWVPERVISGAVAVIFGLFGVYALRAEAEGDSEKVVEQTYHSIFLTTLLLLFVAEFGDKTQIAVAGLASSMAPFAVWLGATLALILVSVLGVWFGRTVLQRIPMEWLHRLSGVIFILFALFAGWRALSL
jgi:putative Ca2+/H+ antiporter (TMEM165/GDT1 family)